MKKLVILFSLLIVNLGISISQSYHPCLPGGIIFSNQFEIDHFQYYNPGCQEIEGNVQILGTDITNLDSLEVLESIGGDLFVGYWEDGNPSLKNIVGLKNLKAIGGNLWVAFNDSLISLEGLNNLEEIGGVGIYSNTSLENFLEFEKLESLDGDLHIEKNHCIKDVNGFNNLMSIGGDFNIIDNDSLTDITGLSNLESIGGSMFFWYNKLLKNINEFSNLSIIGGDFNFEHNLSLKSLSSLNNLLSIGGSYQVYNCDSLINLNAFHKLNSIGGDFIIYENWDLNNIKEFKNLSQISGDIKITFNYRLESLNGIENINKNSIESLYVIHNSLLSDCAVQSICGFLMDSIGIASIHDNFNGCDSQEEVEEECETVNINTFTSNRNIKIYPNPVKNMLHVNVKEGVKINEIGIYSISGINLLTINNPQQLIDLSQLSPGMYIVEVIADGIISHKNIIVEN